MIDLDKPEIKPWQHGYSIDYLKILEADYEPYNRFTYSPFTKYKKNDIAADLHEGNLHLTSTTSWVETVAKVKSPITCYHDVEIAWKQPGDVVITKVCGTCSALESRLETLKNKDIYIYHWVEDHQYDDMFKRQNFIFIGGKVVTSSEIYGIWFRQGQHPIFNDCSVTRPRPILDPIEKVTLQKICPVDFDLILEIREKIEELDLEYAKSDLTAYVNKDWSALSLRGYSSDPSFIADPNEMSKSWNEKHKGEEFVLQDTPLFDHFPMIKSGIIEDILCDCQVHRVTLMRMKPNGVLQRHTDQIDWNHGLAMGKLVRFHIPIKTNENVQFLAWELDGNVIEMNLQIGSMYVLDTRKPHKVICNTDQERIHLTIDCRINQDIYNLILNL